MKFGEIIGFASVAIAPGDWVHSHNLSADAFSRQYSRADAVPAAPPALANQFFQGYRRADGRAGTRNYIAIISSVNCSASVSKQIARRFAAAALAAYPNVDGVVAFTHGGGCGMQFEGLQHQILNRVLGGIARHPNIGGYLLVGLGCETATIGHLLSDQRLIQISGLNGRSASSPADGSGRSGEQQGRGRPPVLAIQDLGGTQRTIDEGIRLVTELLPQVNDVRRVPISAAELVLGTNCGGSTATRASRRIQPQRGC